ncbi:hypothetical protein FACS1894187_07090 [Synergistales bacterium]|nr:hypothetical protein FACS1894187_07090 [Synergistales bacterium]
MFINTKKSFKIKGDDGTVFEQRAGWIGEVPNWVENHWYFKALCKDGTVTAIVSAKDKAVQVAVKQKPDIGGGNSGGNSELDALRARAAELKIPRYTQIGKDKLTTAIAEAEAEAKLKPADTPDTEQTDGGGEDSTLGDGGDSTPGE